MSPPIPHLPRRLPGRQDAPLEPLEMSEADIVGFGAMIHTGIRGQASWKRKGNHEELVIWLHPDAVNYLPPGVYVISHGNRYEPIGPNGRGGVAQGIQFLLGRDLDSTLKPVTRSGVKETTTVWTSPKEEE